MYGGCSQNTAHTQTTMLNRTDELTDCTHKVHEINSAEKSAVQRRSEDRVRVQRLGFDEVMCIGMNGRKRLIGCTHMEHVEHGEKINGCIIS